MKQQVSDLLEALRGAYDLDGVDATRVLRGHGARNWVTWGPSGTWFVKQFGAERDVSEEREAAAVSEYCRNAGIPTPAVLPTRQDRLLAEEARLLVLEYVAVANPASRLDAQQASDAGALLGRIHDVLRSYPAPLAAETPGWLEFDPERAEHRIRHLIERIDARPERDAFDLESRHHLEQRLDHIGDIVTLLKSVAHLDSRVLHGDYSTENLLFTEGDLRCVIDFGPPRPFLVAYELGRAALQPELLRSPDWLSTATALVRAYRGSCEVSSEDVRCAPRAWLIQLLRSLYGVEQHYLAPRELQVDLDRFWLARAHAAAVLTAELTRVEEAFADA